MGAATDINPPGATPPQAGARLLPGTVPLPGNEQFWENTPLGPPSQWPQLLQSIVVTLSSFEYPAAIFWGQELILLYNQAWEDIGGIDEQASKQRGSLGPDAWHALQTALVGGKPARIDGHDLLRAKDQSKGYTVLASPLFDQNINEPQGVIAQLLPNATLQKLPRRDTSSLDGVKDSPKDSTEDRTLGHTGLDKSIASSRGISDDNVPLDEHPFFHRFAEMLPTGLAILDHQAQAVFVNQHFYALTTHRGDDRSFRSWPQSIHPEDYDRVLGAYHQAFVYQRQLRTEFRALGGDRPWRLLLLTPLGDENLRHVSLEKYGGFICCVVDITSEKSAELTQQQAAVEARERKEQQERFIDMISHEIRNPLSAVLHCVEDIEDAVKPAQQAQQSKTKDTKDSDAKDTTDDAQINITSILEATETINLCIAHQKNIVDDVLSYSKLDSSMLALSPKPSRPSTEMQKSLYMFQPELRKQHTSFSFSIDDEYEAQNIDWVTADLPRIGQVLINLVSNSIKFTAKKEGEQTIACRVSASRRRPTSYPPDVVFFETDPRVAHMDATSRSEWGEGEALYIMFAVEDTGIGISEEGRVRLFERFKQATPKTGEIYGGSGLGLNISRKLVHMHGGEIGVASTEGKGTTFGFFFRVRRSDPPEENSDDVGRETKVKDQIQGKGLSVGDSAKGDEGEPRPAQPAAGANEDVKDGDQMEEYDSTQDRDQQSHLANTAASMERVTRAKKQKSDPMAEAGRGEQQTDGSKDINEQQQNPATHSVDSPRPPSSERPRDATNCQSSPRDSSRPTHVLLVDDNAVNQRIVSRKLRQKEYTITSAENGRQAVELFKENLRSPRDQEGGAFDVILMDKEMPEMDGIAATKTIRELEKEAGIESQEGVVVLGVSANVRGEQQDDMMGVGMDGVMGKPYRIEDMIKEIEKLLERKRGSSGGGGEGQGRGRIGTKKARPDAATRAKSEQDERKKISKELRTPVDKPRNDRQLPTRAARESEGGQREGAEQQQPEGLQDLGGRQYADAVRK